MISNNTRIYNVIKRTMGFAKEQIESEKILTFQQLHRYKQDFLDQLEIRLEVGAKKYQKEVPITSWEKAPTNRDNLLEAIEEYIDASVYQVAEQLDDSIIDQNNTAMINEYHTTQQRSIAHLIYAYFLLRKSLHIRNKLNKSITKEGKNDSTVNV